MPSETSRPTQPLTNLIPDIGYYLTTSLFESSSLMDFHPYSHFRGNAKTLQPTENQTLPRHIDKVISLF